MLTLFIGDKQHSPWSLPPWLLLRHIGEPFRERAIRLGQADSRRQLLAVNPAGLVPVLYDGQLRVHDSLAICEYLHEIFPASQLWPREQAERAEARALCAELHSGFATLRTEMPFDLLHHSQPRPSAACAGDIQRLASIWQQQRQRHTEHGPWLFGRYSIADAMFAAEACRCVSYGIALDGLAAAYADQLLADPALQDWYDAAEAETAATLG